ncbi:MAG: hypothetical protein P8Y13_13925 [Deinococcales bacterium]
MRLLASVLLLLVAAGPAWAAAAPFAALTITPNGPQSYDITTGVTTLPKGGTVIDQDTGVTLHATSMRYVEGKSIEAKDASVSGSFGQLTASTIQIDIPAGTLTASGDLKLTRDALALQAASLRYDAAREVVDFGGPVTGSAPDFQSDRVLLDAKSGDVLLVGHYRFSDGVLTLTSPPDGGRLELHLHQVDGKPVYDAATEVSPALLARFAPELH